jgi:hypothetical protein
MTKEQKKTIDKIISVFMYGIFLPFVLLALIAKGMNICMEYLFENVFNPFYHKVCKIVRGPIPNSVVYILDGESKIWVNEWQSGWRRVNDKLLTIKEAKALGKEYEDKGYKVNLSLSEF